MKLSLRQSAVLVALLCGVLDCVTAKEEVFSQDQCGSARLNPWNNERNVSARIVKGLNQTHGEWPSYARIDESCGGVLISDRQVLTAAHCVTAQMRANLSSIKITLGDHNIRRRDWGEQVQQGVDSICVSSKWRREDNLSVYDFAVIKLRERVKFTDYVQPACLPTSPDERVHLKTCHLVGSGAYMMFIGISLRRETVQKLPMEPASCAPVLVEPSDPSRSCWIARFLGEPQLGQACAGDSGGPILCMDEARRKWTVVALASYGEKDCVNTHFKSLTVFASVPKLLNAIKSECGI